MTLAQIGVVAAILLGGATGTLMLRRAWRCDTGKAPWRAGGLALLALSIVAPAAMLGPMRGVFTALALVSVAALGVVAAGRSIRRARAPRAARARAPLEPAERAGSVLATTLRWSLAGPVGLVAALAVGVGYTVWAPGATQTRLVIGGLIVPLAWGGAMAWTLADQRIGRAAAVLLGTALLGFGTAMVRGFA